MVISMTTSLPLNVNERMVMIVMKVNKKMMLKKIEMVDMIEMNYDKFEHEVRQMNSQKLILNMIEQSVMAVTKVVTVMVMEKVI